MTVVVQCVRFEGDLERQLHAVVKIREQTQMFDQYVVKNRHSLKLRYLDPIRCNNVHIF